MDSQKQKNKTFSTLRFNRSLEESKQKIFNRKRCVRNGRDEISYIMCDKLVENLKVLGEEQNGSKILFETSLNISGKRINRGHSKVSSIFISNNLGKMITFRIFGYNVVPLK